MHTHCEAGDKKSAERLKSEGELQRMRLRGRGKKTANGLRSVEGGSLGFGESSRVWASVYRGSTPIPKCISNGDAKAFNLA